MHKFIARQNIERFRRLIAEEHEGANRALLKRLLAEEEKKLRNLTQARAPPSQHPSTGDTN